MDIYILRHAIALEGGPAFAGHDADRPLSRAGRKKMLRIARGMKSLGLSFDCILSSPFARARQTAAIVAGELRLKKVLEFSAHLRVGGAPARLIAQISRRSVGVRSVLLVGHEPQLSALISLLLSGDEGITLTMKKGGLCKLIVHDLRYKRCATLEWLLTPSQLARLGR